MYARITILPFTYLTRPTRSSLHAERLVLSNLYVSQSRAKRLRHTLTQRMEGKKKEKDTDRDRGRETKYHHASINADRVGGWVWDTHVQYFNIN